MRKLIKLQPAEAEYVLNKCISIGLFQDEIEHVDIRLLEHQIAEINFNYEYIDDESSISGWNTNSRHLVATKQNDPLIWIARSKKCNLLRHPLVERLHMNRWKSTGRYMYLFDMFLYAIFLFSLNTFALLSPPPYAIRNEHIGICQTDRKIYLPLYESACETWRCNINRVDSSFANKMANNRVLTVYHTF